jgi:hypothetical protein
MKLWYYIILVMIFTRVKYRFTQHNWIPDLILESKARAAQRVGGREGQLATTVKYISQNAGVVILGTLDFKFFPGANAPNRLNYLNALKKMLYKHSKSKEIVVLKVQEDGNQSLKEHITLRIFDDRKSLRHQIFNPPRAPKFSVWPWLRQDPTFQLKFCSKKKQLLPIVS